MRETKVKAYEIHGYCLMSNHVHILVKETEEPVSSAIKRICGSYVYWYNWKYNRCGHLFQDRYKSEKVENDGYLTSLVRYIHQNPVKAGMVRRVDEWKWSSCQRYYGKETYPPLLLDSKMILGMFSTEYDTAVKGFIEYNEAQNEDQYMEDIIRRRLTDEEARREISNLAAEFSIPEIKSLPKQQRDSIITKIKTIEGLSQRQAARILGISPNLIFKA